MTVQVKTTYTWDWDNDDTMTAEQVLRAMWPVYYYAIASSNDYRIAGQGLPVYDHAAGLIRALLAAAYPDIDPEQAYYWCIESGELHDGDRLREIIAVEEPRTF